MNKPLKRILPPDPDEMNGQRTEWAEELINRFINATGTDRSDALADMLSNIMHWCDCEGMDFNKELDRARSYYRDETNGFGTAGATPSDSSPTHRTTCSECGAQVDHIIGCPDGAEVCQACFDAGNH